MQGRELRTITFGTGPTTVLLWSQMHGDESTATMALADIFAWLAAPGSDGLRDRLGERLTITFLPLPAFVFFVQLSATVLCVTSCRALGR